MGDSPQSGAVPPPPYTTANISQDGATYPLTQQYPIPSNIKQTNFIDISRRPAIVGIWAIDPTLKIPEELKAPLRPNEERMNIYLKSRYWEKTDNCMVDAVIFIVPSPATQAIKKTTIRLVSIQGSISLQVHDAERQHVSDVRLPVSIQCSAPESNVVIYLPHSFHGPLHLRSSGRVVYSGAVAKHLIQISQVDGVYRNFLGRFDAYEWEESGWKGDELKVTCGGQIEIFFDDERTIPTTHEEYKEHKEHKEEDAREVGKRSLFRCFRSLPLAPT